MKIKVNKIASVTKNLNLPEELTISKEIEAKNGNVIVVKALEEKSVYNQIELVNGRMAKILKGDIIAGVLGERRALKGFKGIIPKKINAGDILNILNLGGVIGLCTSENIELGPPLKVEVIGAAINSRKPLNIKQKALQWKSSLKESAPIIMVSGTCMNSGKTVAACEIIQKLSSKGYKIVAAKLTGVSLMRDTLNMLDHSATKALSFTDAGLPSTTNHEEVVPSSKGIIFELNKSKPDAIVIELGDGILGGYGVSKILEDKELMSFVKAHVMCANDPVGAWGAVELFKKYGLSIDIISGPTTDNEVGVDHASKELGVLAANARTNPDKLAAFVEEKVFVSKKIAIK